jgi:hypothetical protein
MNKLQMIRKRGIVLLLVFFLSCASTSRRDHISILVDSLYKKNANLPCEIIVGYILPDSSADRAGLETGDRVLSVNGKPVNTYREFLNVLRRLPDETESIFTILRNGRETEVALIPSGGRSRLGFRFKIRDPEITKNIKYDIWPSEVDPNIKTFNIFFYAATLMNKNSRSPKRKILQRIKEILINKGYIFTESYEAADFFIETKYKNTKSKIDPTRPPVKNIVPFEAFRVLFLDKKNNKPFLKVSGTIDQEKARIYGAKGYVFSMLDAMIEKFPDYRYRKKISDNFANSEKKLIDDKPPASENRFPGAGPF